jgi:small subunit ribosomal protein S6
MKDYEMVMILDPGLDPTSFEEKTKNLRDKLTKYEGVVQNVTSWGKRKLAYDIAKKDAGYYVVFNFQIPSQGLLDFKENIRHDTEILRYLIVVNRQPLAQMTTTEEETAKEGKDEGEVQEIEAEEEIEHPDKDDLDDHVNEEEK